MNKVELLATIAAKPTVQGEAPLHITFPATVSHKTKSGETRNENYPISAWYATAQWILDNLSVGERAIISGYLAQKKDHSVEVCARQVYPVRQTAMGAVINSSVPRSGQGKNNTCTAEENMAVERINADGITSSAVDTSQEAADACARAEDTPPSAVDTPMEAVDACARVDDTVEGSGISASDSDVQAMTDGALVPNAVESEA